MATAGRHKAQKPSVIMFATWHYKEAETRGRRGFLGLVVSLEAAVPEAKLCPSFLPLHWGNDSSNSVSPLRTQILWARTLRTYIFFFLEKSQKNKILCDMQKQAYESMEQNREPRNKPTHLRSINLCQKRQEYTMEKRQSSSGVGKAGQPHVNQWS